MMFDCVAYGLFLVSHVQESDKLIEGKVDWKGRPATKDKHGGSRTSLLILGKIGSS